MLDIGCGGGKNVFNLKGKFSVTGVDLSPAMLAQARLLNPESVFVLGVSDGQNPRIFAAERAMTSTMDSLAAPNAS